MAVGQRQRDEHTAHPAHLLEDEAGEEPAFGQLHILHLFQRHGLLPLGNVKAAVVLGPRHSDGVIVQLHACAQGAERKHVDPVILVVPVPLPILVVPVPLPMLVEFDPLLLIFVVPVTVNPPFAVIKPDDVIPPLVTMTLLLTFKG